MKPVAFTYLRPQSVDAALVMLAEAGEDAKVIAGGQSLVPMMNLRLARPAWLVDINGLSELQGVRELDATCSIGALTRHRTLEQDPWIRERLPILAEAASWIGHPQIRARGTIGGSLVHADPSAEWPMLCTALGAKMVIKGPQGSRRIAAQDFFVTYMTTALGAQELLTAIEIPMPRIGAGWSVQEIARRHGDFAVVAVAAILDLDEAGRLSSGKLAIGGAAPVPVDAGAIFDAHTGEVVTPALIRAVAEAAVELTDPDSDLHATREYRQAMARLLATRAITEALERSTGKGARA